jgi:hypothetical protein
MALSSAISTRIEAGTMRVFLMRVAKIVATIALASAASTAYAQSANWPNLQGNYRPAVEERLAPIEDFELGDFSGLPLNEAGLAKAQAWDPAIQFEPENQCNPHSVPYIMRSFLPFQIRYEGGNVMIYHQSFEQVRTIYMDGRPAAAGEPTWMGHSVGHWEGDTLVVETTNFKAGYIRTNGAPHSADAHLEEHYFRYGDILTYLVILEDPAYLREPFIDFRGARHFPGLELEPYPCEVRPRPRVRPR